jgi:hypothetical protein
MLEVTTVVRIPGLSKFTKRLRSDPALSRRVTNVWAARYRGFVWSRFARFAAGGGNWKPLSAATLARRRKGSGKGSPAILRDKGQLFNALDPNITNGAGRYTKHIPFGVEIGYGGSAKHEGGSATVAQIAKWHNDGAGNLPQREIIVAPPLELITSMASDCERILGSDLRGDVNG